MRNYLEFGPAVQVMLFNYFSIFGSDESDGTIWMVLENGIMIKQQNNIWVNLL